MPPWLFLALAITLWFGATFFYLGDTGKYSDDYAVHLQDLRTGEIDWSRNPWQRWAYFWRPLHLAHATALNTLSWNHAWIGHLELALIHAAVGWMLWRLLVRLGVRSAVAAPVALLFTLCPLTAEAVLWTSASCNAISSLLLLLAIELMRRHAAGPRTGTRIALIGALGFITPCWYEPAAAALAALPLVYLAVRPASEPWRTRLRGMAWPTLWCGLGCATYAALLLSTAPARARGSVPSLIPPTELPQRAASFARMVWDLVAGLRARDLLGGSIRQGWDALLSPAGWLWLAALALVASAAAIAWIRSRPGRADDPSPPTPRRGSIVGIGAIITLASLLPVLVSDAPGLDLRTMYVPLLGVAFILAGLANGVAALALRVEVRTRSLFALGAGGAALAAACLGAVGMIGFQTNFRTIDRNDRRIVGQLRAVLPDPAPGTVFLPLAISCRGAATGLPRYDHALHGGLEVPSSSSVMVRAAYRRTDISCVSFTFRLGGRVPIGDLAPEGFDVGRTRGGIGIPWHVPWTQAVPFVVDERGNLTIVDRLLVRPLSGAPIEIRPMQVRPLPTHDPPLTAELVENPDGRTSVRIVRASP
jgi:hypothetical protein